MPEGVVVPELSDRIADISTEEVWVSAAPVLSRRCPWVIINAVGDAIAGGVARHTVPVIAGLVLIAIVIRVAFQIALTLGGAHLVGGVAFRIVITGVTVVACAVCQSNDK